jgi:tight adherence protein C
MNNLQNAIGGFFQDPGTLLLVVIFALVFVGVMGAAQLFNRGATAERFSHTQGGSQGSDPARDAVTLRYQRAAMTQHKLFKYFERLVARPEDAKVSSLRQRLIRAGYPQPWALSMFYIARLGMVAALGGASLLLLPVLTKNLSLDKALLIGCAAAMIGLYLPSIFVTNLIQKRQTASRDGFPDSLDLMLICVEAGLGLDAALNRVAEEVAPSNPVLSEHYANVGLELRAGRSREQALRSMADRIGLEEVNSLVTLLIQSDHLGTSVAQTLRVYADDMRNKRIMRAEEKANMLPVKLVIPVVLFILPSLMTVVMGPAIIRILRTLAPAIGAGG